MTRIGVQVAVAAALAFAACPGPPPGSPPAVSRVVGSTPGLVQAALPAVVLVVSERPDGKLIYGSGVLVGDDDRVLTNMHLLAGTVRTRVMLHRADRPSYTPMDGGLDRYLFENQRELVEATLLVGDPTVDLAVLAVGADTRSLPRLRFAAKAIRPGDRVLALGHPGETVWSFTSGVVSAIHHGAIQHDAAVNTGSSGGPLLNDCGELVGINTSKLLAGIDGVAFARPVSMAMRLLDDRAPAPVDLARLEGAVVGCFHAQELASPGLPDCLDWDLRWRAFQEAGEDVGRILGVGGDGWILPGAEREAWVGRERAAESARRQGATIEGACALRPELTDLREGADLERLERLLGEERTRLAGLRAGAEKRLVEVNGFRADPADQQSVQRTIKMGIRIDEVRRVEGDRAWVLLGGRNVDGSAYRLTELWRLRGRQWRQQSPVPPEALATLPEGWPPPMNGFEQVRTTYLIRVLDRLVRGACERADDGWCCAPDGAEALVGRAEASPQGGLLGGTVRNGPEGAAEPARPVPVRPWAVAPD